MEQRRYIINQTQQLLREPNPRSQLIQSLTSVVRECPPKTPWTTRFKDKPMGLWTGPTSIAYVFLWLSKTHQDLTIDGTLPQEWCDRYLDCGSGEILSAQELNGWGIKNEYLAYNAVMAARTNEASYVSKLEAVVSQDFSCPNVDNEHLSGRAGTLALLRLVRAWYPASQEQITVLMKPLIEHIIGEIPWRFHGHNYIGAAHGAIGILTQIVLCMPKYGKHPAIEEQLDQLLRLQTPDGHWFVTDDPKLGSPDLVHYCHGSPGFVISLLAIRPLVSERFHARIDKAVETGRRQIWEKGLLTKQPNLCHGITGNMLALGDWEQKEHFQAHATMEKMEEGIRNGLFVPGDDKYGLLWGEAGRAWGWIIMDIGKDLGYPSYTDV